MKIRAALLSLLFVAPATTLLADQQADDLNTKYIAAKQKSQYDLAMQYICDAAKIDPAKYSATCNSVSSYVNSRLKAFQDAIDIGKVEMGNKEWAKAMRDFSSITFGPNYSEAQTLYAQAKKNAEAPAVDPNAEALKAAHAAFDVNDFATAEADLQKVKSPDLQPQAQDMLNNIRNYTSLMQQGDALQANKKYPDALKKYTAAMAIKSNGPGNPAAKVQVVTALTAVSKPVGPPAAIDNTQKIRTAMAEASEYKSRGNWQGVLTSVDRVLALDPKQQDALSLKAEAQDAMKAQLAKDPKALEDTLATGIRNYYQSDFSEANSAINLYIKAGGTRIGAAHFYLGATMISQALFADPKNKDENSQLQQGAMKEFQQAKQAKFKPVEKAVSPKVLAVWNQNGL